MAGNLKKELIQKTYQILVAEGFDNIKIRRIAADIGCTSTVVYKHFDNLDHLISFASIRILQDYIQDFIAIRTEDINALDMNLKLWECFAGYAFRNAYVFELLFWGRYKEQLGDMIYEYYLLFKDEMTGFDGLSASVLFNNDLKDREYIMLRRSAATGYLSFDDIEMLSDLVSCMFHGMLLEYIGKCKDQEVTSQGVQRFIKMLSALMGKYRLK